MEQDMCRAYLAAFLLLLMPGPASPDNGDVLRFGLYQNPPKIYAGESGEPSGFWPRIVTELAARDAWAPHWVPCEWAECLRMLERGDIDVMPDVAPSDMRDQRFVFGSFPVLHSWSEIYHKPALPVNRLSDLSGRRIAVMADSIQQRSMQSDLAERGIDAEFILTPSLESAVERVRNGEADLAVVNRFVGEYALRSSDLVSSGIVVNPTALFFAFSPGTSRTLIHAIDAEVARLKENADSEYYAAVRALMTPETGPFSVPRWVWWSLAAAAATLALSGIAILLLRRMVAERTADLSQSRSEYRALASGLLSDRENERKGIARDIHDELGQDLTAMKLELHSLLASIPENSEATSIRQRLDSHVNRAIESIRRIASDLRPPLLDDFGLAAAIEAMAEDFRHRTGIECHVDIEVPDEIELDEDGATQAFRILQESLTNVARHANASRVAIAIQQSGDELVLSVTDNGVGIGTTTHMKREGLGILGMRERAAGRGWHLDLRNAPDGGTQVRLIIPVSASGHPGYSPAGLTDPVRGS